MTFFCFPDRLVDPVLLRRAGALVGSGTIPHASGRPWLLGDVDRFTVARIDEERIVRVAERAGGDSKAGRDLRTLPFEAVAGDAIAGMSTAECVVLAGSVSGERRLFHSRRNGTVVVSDSAAALARLHGRRLDAREVAVRLNRSLPLYPFAVRSPWAGVHAVHPHHRVRIAHDGTVTTARWWSAPPGTVDVDHGAAPLRTALDSSIAEAVVGGGSISCDLSGGLDSTSIAYLLVAAGAEPMAFHARSSGAYNDDITWAKAAAADLGLPLHELDPFGDEAAAFRLDAAPREALDAPILWAGSAGYLQRLRARLATGGSGTHFTGVGGDELFGPVPAIAWSIFGERGLRALPEIRRIALATRAPLAVMMTNVRDRDTLRQAIEAIIHSDGAPAGRSAAGRWFATPHWPDALTPNARRGALDVVRTVFESDAGDWTTALDDDRGRHQMLESLLFQGQVLEQINRVHGNHVRSVSPFLRRASIEAAARVSMTARIRPGVAKPLLAAAMAPRMPHAFFRRPVSGEYSADTYRELASRRSGLAASMASTVLAQAGLIDAGRLGTALSKPAPAPETVSFVENVVAVENWVSAAETEGVGL